MFKGVKKLSRGAIFFKMFAVILIIFNINNNIKTNSATKEPIVKTSEELHQHLYI